MSLHSDHPRMDRQVHENATGPTARTSYDGPIVFDAFRNRRRAGRDERGAAPYGKPGMPRGPGPVAGRVDWERIAGDQRPQHEVRRGYAFERVPGRMHLFTATIMHTGGNVMLQAFHASVAREPLEIVERLCRRHGGVAAAHADIRMGFHPANPLVLALVPCAVAEVIRRVERQSDRTDNHTFAVDIEQRIEA